MTALRQKTKNRKNPRKKMNPKKTSHQNESANPLRKLEEIADISFKNEALLREAMTHRSFLNENPRWPFPQNERLEYLGDAVLELVVTDHLFREYPDHQEGELTSLRAALVNHTMLSRIANELNLQEFICLSRGEAKDTGRAREAILANAVEALIGAIYLDRGYASASAFVKKRILIHLNEVVEKELFLDSKSLLQEIAQEKYKITPTYTVISETGPDHKKEFISGVFFGEKIIARGKGFSKQEAERDAAANALKKRRA